MQEKLEQLIAEGLQLPAENVSAVLPQAIVYRSSQDRQLTVALRPTVEEALQASVRRDPQPLVDALSPAMGPAIRKAISYALNGMLQSLNQALRHSFSLRGLIWRLEALRTGKTFAEVVLSHTLLYRVEQVFLIHKKTGLLLQQATADAAVMQDADMVSGMLTAIQDFVHDSFGGQNGQALDTLQVGDLTLWIEQGSQAILSAVIRGNTPQVFRSTLQATTDAIHLEYREALTSFRGDAAPFASTQPYLEACLLEAQEDPSTQRLPVAFWLILAAILLPLGLWGFWTLRDNQRWADYLAQLSAEPGIVVTTTEKRWGKYVVSGLRDPLAVDPLLALKETKLDPAQVLSHWEPYQALHLQFILARAKSLLEPPDTVALELKNGALLASGIAPRQWIIDARKLARTIAGVTQFQGGALIAQDLKEIEWRKEQLEKQVVRFVIDTTQLGPKENETMRAALADIRRLYDIALAAGQRTHIDIVGHASSEGTEKRNIELSQERANLVRSILISEGLEATASRAVGAGTAEPVRDEVTEEDRAWNRSVSFRVSLTDLLTIR